MDVLTCTGGVGRLAVTFALVVATTHAASDRTTTLLVNGRSSATPTIAADGAFVVVTWSASLPAGTTDVFAAVSRDGAQTFAAPVRVNDVPGDARVNGEQPPRVVLSPRSGAVPSVTIVWTTKGKSGTRLVSSRSDDGGRSFSAAATVSGSDAAGNRGWENATADRSGRVFAVWLDHREMADHSMAAGHHQHGEDPASVKPPSDKPDGVAMAQLSKLYVGTLDGSVAPHAVAPGVCYCCKTAIAAGQDGTIYSAWRHVYAGNMRDIAFTLSRDGGRTFAAPVRVSEDQWMLEGCPDDGPAIAVDGRGGVHVVWPTLVKDEKTGEPAVGIFYAVSADGKRFTPRLRAPTEGVAHHPQIVLDAAGAPVLAWDESGVGSRRIVVARADRGANGSMAFTRSVSSVAGVYPSIATTGGTILVAATTPGAGISLRRLP